MNAGKTLFAQLMEFIPRTSFDRIVTRYSGNSGVRRPANLLGFGRQKHGLICDQTIAMNGFHIAKDYPEHLRRIRFKGPEKPKHSFTRKMACSMPTAYQQRRQTLATPQVPP